MTRLLCNRFYLDGILDCIYLDIDLDCIRTERHVDALGLKLDPNLLYLLLCHYAPFKAGFCTTLRTCLPVTIAIDVKVLDVGVVPSSSEKPRSVSRSDMK